MITFKEYHMLMEAPVAPLTPEEMKQRQGNNAEVQAGATTATPPAGGASDPTAQGMANRMGNNQAVQNPAYPQGAPAGQGTAATAAAPAAPAPSGAQPAGPEGYMAELEQLKTLQGQELKDAWTELYGRINAEVNEVGAANNAINQAAADDPMGAVGVPDDERYGKAMDARTAAVQAGRQQGFVDSRQIRELENGHLEIIFN